jgi:uncharacterized membrane protein YgaE (UPF0421/DUF939 family)
MLEQKIIKLILFILKILIVLVALYSIYPLIDTQNLQVETILNALVPSSLVLLIYIIFSILVKEFDFINISSMLDFVSGISIVLFGLLVFLLILRYLDNEHQDYSTMIQTVFGALIGALTEKNVPKRNTKIKG